MTKFGHELSEQIVYGNLSEIVRCVGPLGLPVRSEAIRSRWPRLLATRSSQYSTRLSRPSFLKCSPDRIRSSSPSSLRRARAARTLAQMSLARVTR